MGQSNKQDTRSKKEYRSPWLCSLGQILQRFVPGANPNLITPLQNSCTYGADIALRFYQGGSEEKLVQQGPWDVAAFPVFLVQT